MDQTVLIIYEDGGKTLETMRDNIVSESLRPLFIVIFPYNASQQYGVRAN
jgi:hypothetical protein